MIIYVEERELCTYSSQEPEQFGSWEDQFCYSIVGVSEKQENSWDSGYEVEPDEYNQVYVLSIEYGSGDSFGSASGRGEVVYVFSSYELADKAKKQLENDRGSYSKEIDLGNGKSFTFSDPSVGYFEWLESANIDIFRVTK